MLAYLKEYCSETSLHGLNHIVALRRHWSERLLWGLICLASLTFSCVIITSSWNRYQNNPVVIAVVRDFRNWQYYIPATAIFLENRLDELRATNFINGKWNLESGPKFEYYMRFLLAVANISIYQVKGFEEFVDDEELQNINFFSIHEAVNKRCPTMFSDGLRGRKPYIPTLLEIGYACTGLSVITKAVGEYQFQNPYGNKTMQIDEHYLTECTYHKGSCASFILDYSLPGPSSYVYTYSNDDIPDALKAPIQVPFGTYRQLKYNNFVLTADSGLRKLNPKQRNCYFSDEKTEPSLPYYTIDICYMRCRRDMIIKYCGCVPHFYPQKEKIPICNITGLICLASKIEEVINATLATTKMALCNCLVSCELTSFGLMSMEDGPVKDQMTYSWRLLDEGKIRYRREIIFEFSDLLVSYGGTLGLFLGCSLLSGIELIYFFTIRLLRIQRGKKEQDKSELQRTNKRVQQLSFTHSIYF